MKTVHRWFVSAILLLGFAIPVPAAAQAVSFQSYYEDQVIAFCSVTGCPLHFSAVPQNMLITSLSCRLVTSATLVSMELGVTDNITDTVFRRLRILGPLPQSIVSSGVNWYSMGWTTDFLIGAGKFPGVNVLLSSFGSAPLD